MNTDAVKAFRVKYITGEPGKKLVKKQRNLWRLKMSENIKLLECPFCGAFPRLRINKLVYCSDIDCPIENVGLGVAQWNTRATPTPHPQPDLDKYPWKCPNGHGPFANAECFGNPQCCPDCGKTLSFEPSKQPDLEKRLSDLEEKCSTSQVDVLADIIINMCEPISDEEAKTELIKKLSPFIKSALLEAVEPLKLKLYQVEAERNKWKADSERLAQYLPINQNHIVSYVEYVAIKQALSSHEQILKGEK